MTDYSRELETNLMCDECGNTNVQTTFRKDRFVYGVGDNAVELEAEIPVCECNDCGFKFIPFEAEELKHEAICDHLGVMPPAEVLQIRTRYGSRSNFSDLTGVGEASIGRWERGALIQNTAYDRYLWLLSYDDNAKRLEQYRTSTREEPEIIPFPSLAEKESIFDDSQAFQLRPRKQLESIAECTR